MGRVILRNVVVLLSLSLLRMLSIQGLVRLLMLGLLRRIDRVSLEWVRVRNRLLMLLLRGRRTGRRRWEILLFQLALLVCS